MQIISLTVLASLLVVASVASQATEPSKKKAELQAEKSVEKKAKTTIKSEKKIVKLIFDGAFANQCHFFWPKSWALINGKEEPSFIATPMSGDYFSKYQFQYFAGLAGTSLVDDIFIAGEDVDYESQLADKGSISREEFNKILQKRKKTSGFILNNLTLDEVNDSPTQVKPIGSFNVRSKISYEDGASIESAKIYILNENEKITANVSIFPQPNPYFNPITDKPVGYTFGCEASAKMDTSIFSTLCSNLIERATLSARYPDFQCEITEKGLKYSEDS